MRETVGMGKNPRGYEPGGLHASPAPRFRAGDQQMTGPGTISTISAMCRPNETKIVESRAQAESSPIERPIGLMVDTIIKPNPWFHLNP